MATAITAAGAMPANPVARSSPTAPAPAPAALRRRPLVATPIAALTTLSLLAALTILSSLRSAAERDARVQDRVEHVHYRVDQHKCGDQYQGDALHDG